MWVPKACASNLRGSYMCCMGRAFVCVTDTPTVMLVCVALRRKLQQLSHQLRRLKEMLGARLGGCCGRCQEDLRDSSLTCRVLLRTV